MYTVYSLNKLILLFGCIINSHCDWNKLNDSSKKALNIDNVTQSYALVFYKMLEYNDLSDSVDMSIHHNNSDQIIFYPFNTYKWERNSIGDKQVFTVNNLYNIVYNGTNNKLNPNGEVIIKFHISNTTQRNPDMPHLMFLPGWIVQFDILFNNLTSHFNQSRYGLQLIMISNLTLKSTEEFRKDILFSLDDEVTPSNFEMINLLLGHSVSRSNITTTTTSNSSSTTNTTESVVNVTSLSESSIFPSGFIQIKPVCFIDDQLRTVQNSRNIFISKHQDNIILSDNVDDYNKTDHLSKSILDQAFPSIFYADRLYPNMKLLSPPVGIRLLNISFGSPMDGFYASSKFIVWTASFGLGSPPTDSLSSLLTGLIILSMVILVCSIILGSILTVILRRRTSRPSFSHFVNDPVA
ncbi:unnamed protein product [Heterobilharzia americana]|nr:unnamed protein product [Heterobilharzia americana]